MLNNPLLPPSHRFPCCMYVNYLNSELPTFCCGDERFCYVFQLSGGTAQIEHAILQRDECRHVRVCTQQGCEPKTENRVFFRFFGCQKTNETEKPTRCFSVVFSSYIFYAYYAYMSVSKPLKTDRHSGQINENQQSHIFPVGSQPRAHDTKQSCHNMMRT